MVAMTWQHPTPTSEMQAIVYTTYGSPDVLSL
jgi:hypothetical protein